MLRCFLPLYLSLLKGTITSSGNDDRYFANSTLIFFLSVAVKLTTKSISPKSFLVPVLYEPDGFAPLNPGNLLNTLLMYS